MHIRFRTLLAVRGNPRPQQVKSLKTPPKGVKLTMEVCCIMFDVKPNKVKDPDSGKKVRAPSGTVLIVMKNMFNIRILFCLASYSSPLSKHAMRTSWNVLMLEGFRRRVSQYIFRIPIESFTPFPSATCS